MDRAQLQACLDEYVEIELWASKIYRHFSWSFPTQRAFWWRLSMEELSHASMLRAAKDFLRVGQLPETLCPLPLEMLQETSGAMAELFEEIERHPPDLQHACELALDIETGAAEKHLYDLAQGQDPHPLFALMQRLSKADSNHLKEIKDLLERTQKPQHICN